MAIVKVKQNQLHNAIKHLYLTIKVIASYPKNHPSAQHAINKSYHLLTSLLNKQKILTTAVVSSALLVDDITINEKNEFSSKFVIALSNRNIQSITFSKGLSLEDYKIFLGEIAKRPDVLQNEGGLAKILKIKKISNISINEIKYGRISKEKVDLGNKAIIDFLSGKEAELNGSKEIFFYLLKNSPQKISELIRTTSDKTNSQKRKKITINSLQRIAAQIISTEQMSVNSFKNIFGALLLFIDSETKKLSLQELLIEEHKNGNSDGILESAFFYDAVAQTISQYIERGEKNKELIERLLPTDTEKKKILPYLEKKLQTFGNSKNLPFSKDNFFPEAQSKIDTIQREEEKSNETNITNKKNEKLLNPKTTEKEKIKEKTFPEAHPKKKSEHYDITQKVINCLSQGKTQEAQSAINEYSQKLDDKSWEIRNKYAESFHDIISKLDEFDKLKDNFSLIANLLIKKLKEEHHADTYLTLTKNFHRACILQNRIEAFYLDETIGSRLFQAHKLDKDQLQKLLLTRNQNKRSLQYNLGALNLAEESVLTSFIAQQYKGFPVINISDISQIPDNVLGIIPIEYIKRYLVLPFKIDDRRLFTVMENPRNVEVITDLQFIVGSSIVPFVGGEYFLINAIEKYYSTNVNIAEIDRAMESINKEEEDLEFIQEKEEESSNVEELESESAQGPVVRLVNLILKQAIAQNASDIHIEPFENELLVRLRVDGTLFKIMSPPYKYKNSITSRIKIMSRLNIAERRLPQDGKFKVKINEKYLDIRVSTFPGSFGEKVVMRLLDKANLQMDLSQIDMRKEDLDAFRSTIYKSKGMVLVTGPTGSGKTTTLYSILSELNDGTKNISTAEDPIEYNLPGVNQFQMNAKIGLDFAQALRSFLRQDPDILMMGEIRDLETAQIAVRAALTGHLVLSTLHTNSATETIVRLLDMGIEPFLVANSVSLVIAQRLLRKICSGCKTEISLNQMQKELIKNNGVDPESVKFYSGKGCFECNHTGFKGRCAIYEVLPMRNELKEMITNGESSLKLINTAKKLGFETLQQSGFKKVLEGVTTIEEWLRLVL